jgi:hypothetical protein
MRARKSEIVQMLTSRIFKEKVGSSQCFVKPELLPPTDSAIKYHSFRCYCQILLWEEEHTYENPCSLGWQIKDNQ